MNKAVPLSTIIDADVKKAAIEYCRQRGFKLRYFIEKALLEQIEDAIDVEAYYKRSGEDTISFEEVIALRKKKRK